jgi:circadian clock protein KaiC
VEEVERVAPGIVVVDSFRSIARGSQWGGRSGMELDHFVQRLALHLTTWEVTSFLLGEYSETDEPNPVFTVADGVLWLSQVTDRNSVVRKFQVKKMRGRAPMPGLHTFRITGGGVQIFPRIPEQQRARITQTTARHSTGVPGLDELMGGGIPLGDVVLIAGPAGSGKTTFASQFVAEAHRTGDAVVVAVFEEYPEEYLARSQARAQGLHEMAEHGKLKLIYLRPLDLSVDETLAEILEGVEEVGANRVVIDSLSGFEVALAPAFREDFQESLYRLVGALTATGVTVYMTSEVVGSYPDVRFTSGRVSFITDNVIAQRYVEIGGRLQKVLSVVKMRGSQHSSEFRTYEVGATGATVGGPLHDYHGILTGNPSLMLSAAHAGPPGLTNSEANVLEALIRLGSAGPEPLAARVGLPAADVSAALTRIVALGFAVPVADETDVFRAVAQ